MKKKRRRKSRLAIVLVLVFMIVFTLLSVRNNPKKDWEAYYEALYSTQYQDDFIALLAKPAQESYIESGVFPSIVIAQAILESDWGRSALSTDAFNYFGIKGSYNDESVDVVTDEYTDSGERITIVDRFRKYPSIRESLSDHSTLMLSQHYTRVRDQNNYRDMAHALQKSGYATDQNYADKLIEIIEIYNLHELDTLNE